MRALKGFTLLELLVTMSIVAIMALLTITGAKRFLGSAQQAACVNNLRQIGQASLMYNGEKQYFLPWYTRTDGYGQTDVYWWKALSPYIGPDQRVFHCPSDKAFRADQIASTISYGWNYVLTGHGDLNSPADFVRTAQYGHPSTVLIAADGPGGAAAGQEDSWGFIDYSPQHTPDPNRHFGKANGLFLDGHVETLTATNFINNLDYSVRTRNMP